MSATTARREPIPAAHTAPQTMHAFIIHSSTGPWRVLARSVSHARLIAAELEPTATVLRIERQGQW